MFSDSCYQCSIFDVQFSILDVRYSIHNVPCSMLDFPFQMFDVRRFVHKVYRRFVYQVGPPLVCFRLLLLG